VLIQGRGKPGCLRTLRTFGPILACGMLSLSTLSNRVAEGVALETQESIRFHAPVFGTLHRSSRDGHHAFLPIRIDILRISFPGPIKIDKKTIQLQEECGESSQCREQKSGGVVDGAGGTDKWSQLYCSLKPGQYEQCKRTTTWESPTGRLYGRNKQCLV
jgi:hypothetical protein